MKIKNKKKDTMKYDKSVFLFLFFIYGSQTIIYGYSTITLTLLADLLTKNTSKKSRIDSYDAK